jgi:hypothetical protein
MCCSASLVVGRNATAFDIQEAPPQVRPTEGQRNAIRAAPFSGQIDEPLVDDMAAGRLATPEYHAAQVAQALSRIPAAC